MAGSGKFKGQQELKNKAMLVVRNITQQEVTNVIFPNGITVGLDGVNFKSGFKVNGNAQISGVVNSQGYKVNGEDLSFSGQPFLFLDVNTYAAAFDNSSDTTPTPSSVDLTVTQQSQATLFQASDLTAKDALNNTLTISSFNSVTSSSGSSISTATLTLPTAQNKYPVTITAQNDGLTSVKKIVGVPGGDDGNPGATPETLILDLNTSAVSFDDSTDTSPTPSRVGITVTQTGQSSTITAGDITATKSDGVTNLSIGSVSITSPSTGNSVTTAEFSAPQTHSDYPLTVTVSKLGRTSSKTVAAVIGGDDASSAAIRVIQQNTIILESGANTTYQNSSVIVNDLHSQQVNVGSTYTHADVVSSSNTIDDAAKDGTFDSVLLPAGTHSIEYTLNLVFGPTPANYTVSSGIAQLSAIVSLVAAADVTLSSHGDATSTYGTEFAQGYHYATWTIDGSAYPSNGAIVPITITSLNTIGSPAYIWPRVDYAITNLNTGGGGFMHSHSGAAVLTPFFKIQGGQLIVTKIA